MTTRAARSLLVLAAALLIALAVALRLLGFYTLELWCDEALWASRLVKATEAGGAWIRPAGYMWLTRLLVGVVNNEQMLRSLSYVAGIALVPLCIAVYRRLTSLGPALVGAFLVAISPVAVAMTKEFKPYMVETALHAALVLLALVAASNLPGTRPRTKTIARAAVLCLALVAPLFSWTTVFVYPALFAVLAVPDLIRVRAASDGAAARRLAVVAAAAGAVLATLVAIARARVKVSDATWEHWSHKYEVFYSRGDGGTGSNVVIDWIAWFADKSFDLAAFPARVDWSTTLLPAAPAATVASLAAAMLVVGGVAALAVRRRAAHLALLVSPWLVAVAFNLAHRWPYGAFRTNTFFLFYTTALLVVGAAALASLVERRAPPWLNRRVGPALVAVVVVALFPVRLEPFRRKDPQTTMTGEASMRKAMERLIAIETAAHKSVDERRLLVGDGHACRIYNYYRDVHDGARVELHAWLSAHFDVTCARGEARPAFERKLDEVLGPSRPAFWLMTANPRLKDVARARLARGCERLRIEEFPASTTLFRCERPPS